MDHLLQSLNWEREYIQLHRDTTVQSLTLVSKVEHGVVSFEDSPLVKAVVHGRVLVVDEADKAPLEVDFLYWELWLYLYLLLLSRICRVFILNAAASTGPAARARAG